MAIKDTTYEKQRRSRRHVHKYRRISLKFATVWRCADPLCSHYMPPHMEELLIGRGSLCNECDSEIIMDEDTMKMDIPLCADCIAKSKPETISTDMFEEYLAEHGSIGDKIGSNIPKEK